MRKKHRQRPFSLNVGNVGRTTERRAPADVVVTSTCWCERATVGVRQSELLAGLTRPCNHPECVALDLEKRASS